jgi:hypothetical protein
MTAAAGQMLVDVIVPLITGAIARGAVKGTGCEDKQELTAEAVALAARSLDSLERRGKTVPAKSVAYYSLESLKRGRRSGYAGTTDVMSAAATLCGHASLRSMDAPMVLDGDDPDAELTLHDALADTAEDVDVAVARRMDWDKVMTRLDARNKAVVKAMAAGYGTNAIADQIKVSPPRVCQIKESLGHYVVDVWGNNGISEASTSSQWRAGLRATDERRAARHDRARA